MRRGFALFFVVCLTLSTLFFVSSQNESLPFIRGDVDVDGRVSIDDVIYLLNFFYGERTFLLCEDSADVDDDGVVNINDAVFLMDFLFSGNVQELPSPNLKEEVDLTSDNLRC